MDRLPRDYERQIAKKRIPGLLSAIAAAENRAVTLPEVKARAEAARARSLRAVVTQLLAELGEEEAPSTPNTPNISARRRAGAAPSEAAATQPSPATAATPALAPTPPPEAASAPMPPDSVPASAPTSSPTGAADPALAPAGAPPKTQPTPVPTATRAQNSGAPSSRRSPS